MRSLSASAEANAFAQDCFKSAARSRLAAGLVLHEPDGRLTAAAEGVLREGRGLDL